LELSKPIKAFSFAPPWFGRGETDRAGFTLVELLTVMAIIAVLSGLLLPALSQARERARAIGCLNNTRQLLVAWQLYADDNGERLPYNLGMAGSSFRSDLNWVNDVMTWDLSSDNTNPATLTQASLGPLVGGNTAVYHCPSDQALSSIQLAAGWTARIRSYSMNAMVGDAGTFSTNGFNVNNPGYTQFFKSTQIPHPTQIFVFLDEHPDSINDGYFLDQAPPNAGTYNGVSTPHDANWTHLPASYHNRATSFSFADGHSELHRWSQPSTMPPAVADAAKMPIWIPANPAVGLTDFYWVLEHMSVIN